MDEIRELEQAIQALEDQREALGSAVVDTAVAALRQRLDGLRRAQGREEHKQVTILFSDLVGFSSLSARLGPEETREALDTYLRGWSDCIQNQGGVVEKFIGDAVMAVFGLAAAQEDDPQRAVAAALSMRNKLVELNRDYESQFGIKLEMRTGIHTGPALVSTLGERPGQEFVVVGETVNLASRLQDAAPTNAILISEATHRLVQGLFEAAPFGVLKLKGISHPVAAFTVSAERRRTANIPRGLRGAQVTLVGRSAELGRLRLVFERALEEQRSWIVTITGPPGIGKTRLLAEFEGWLATRSINMVTFKASAYEQHALMPFWLLRRLFSNWCKILDSDPIDVARSKFELNISSHFPDAGQMKAHWIGALLGFDFSNSPHLKETNEVAQSLRERGLKYLEEFFCTLSQGAMVFILFDDIHWADAATLEALQRIVQNCPNLPLMAVCLSRQRLEDHHPEWKSRLAGANYASLWMSLRPLSQVESAQIIGLVLGSKPRLPSGLRDSVLEAASGNPFYLEEFLKMMMEEHILHKNPGSRIWQVDQQRLDSWHVPASLTAVIQGRLDSLAPPERRLLQKAAVIGGVFWDLLLQIMIDQPENLSAPLTTLQHRAMISLQPRSAFHGTLEYRFNQSLLREVVYDTILKRQRRDDHRTIAGWLAEMVESTGRGEEFAALIAHHYQQSGDQTQSAGWLLRAGRHARSQGALVESRRFLDLACKLLPETERELLWDILLERDQLLGELGDLPARQADDKNLLELADELGGTDRRAFAYRAVSGTYYQVGEMRQALEASEIALQAAKQAGDQKIENYIYGWKIPILVAIGELEQARGMAEKALNFLEELDDELEIARTLVLLSVYYTTIGDLGMAVRLLERQIKLSRENGFLVGETFGVNNLGYCYARLGRFSQAVQILEKAEKVSASLGLHNLAWIRVNLGLALQFLGELDKSHHILEKAAVELAASGDLFGQAFGLVYDGLALEKSGKSDQACDAYQKAVDLFRQKAMFAYALESQAYLARCLVARGEMPRALEMTAEVWDYLAANPASVMESPVEVCLACAQVYERCASPDKARLAIQLAHQELFDRADRISDPAWRRDYLEKIPAHREVERLYLLLPAG